MHFPSDFSTFSYYLLLNNNISRLPECLYLIFFTNPFWQILYGKKAGAYLKLSQTTEMGPICASISILDFWPGCEYASEQELVISNATAWKVSVLGVLLVCLFPHSDWIRRETEYLSVFSANMGKYGPEKLRIRTLFTQGYN